MSTFAPASGVTESKAKEFLSVAFLRALAAQAGLNVRPSGEYDDGLDWDVGSIKKPFRDLPCSPNTWLSFQLKATSNWSVVGDALSFWLDRDTYDLLRDECITRTLLLVYCLPQDRARWVTFCSRNGQCDLESHYCEMSHAGFYLDLRGESSLPTASNGEPQTGKTVHVPLQNRLTADSLIGLYRSAIEAYAGGGSE